MIRCAFLLLAASLAPLATAAENEAEQLFREAEKNLNAAKTVQNHFEVKVKEFKIQGTLHIGEGDAMRMDCTGTIGAVRFTPPSVVGDGKTLAVVSAPPAKVVVSKSSESPKGLGTALRGMLTRPGVLLEFNTITAGKEPAKDAATFHLVDFKLGAKEKLGDIDTQIVEYNVAVKGKTISVWLGAIEQMFPLKGTEKATAKMWVDTKTKQPLKLVINADLDGNAVEFTQVFTIDGKLDAKLFEVPK